MSASTQREDALVAVAVSLTLEDGEAVRQSVIAGKQAGLTNDDIASVVQTILALRGRRLAALGRDEAAGSAAPARSTCCC